MMLRKKKPPSRAAPLFLNIPASPSYRRLFSFESKRRISKYNQTSVTSNPAAANHSIYRGAPAAAPFSIKSKSKTRFSAAIATTNKLNTIPIVPLWWMYGISRPNIARTQPTMYVTAMAPVAPTIINLKFCVALISPVRYTSSNTASVPIVNVTAEKTIPWKRASYIAETAPKTKPSASAYAGARTGDHSRLNNIVKNATTPATRPAMAQLIACAPPSTRATVQVYAPLHTNKNNSAAVLCTVPLIVMASAPVAGTANALSFNIGLFVLISYCGLYSNFGRAQ